MIAHACTPILIGNMNASVTDATHTLFLCGEPIAPENVTSYFQQVCDRVSHPPDPRGGRIQRLGPRCSHYLD